MADTRDERLERFAVVRLPSSRKRAHCATMEAPQRGDYASAPAGDTRKFESPLYRFSPTVTEKDACKSFRHEMGKTFKQASAHIVVDNLRAGDETLGLRCDSLGHLRSSMSDVRYAVARGTVDIFAPSSIP